MPMTLVRGVLVAVVLVAGACASSGDDEASTDPSTTTSVAAATTTTVGDGVASSTSRAPGTTVGQLTASFRGVTEDTIRIGVALSDLEALRELGLVDIDRGDEELVWQTFVDEINGRGGINGRQLEMTWAPYVPTQETSAAEACITLTEDVEVFAAIGGIRGPAATVNRCFITDHETIMVGGTHTPDLLTDAVAPWISDVMSARPEVFRRSGAAGPGGSARRHRRHRLRLQRGVVDGRRGAPRIRCRGRDAGGGPSRTSRPVTWPRPRRCSP